VEKKNEKKKCCKSISYHIFFPAIIVIKYYMICCKLVLLRSTNVRQFLTFTNLHFWFQTLKSRTKYPVPDLVLKTEKSCVALPFSIFSRSQFDTNKCKIILKDHIQCRAAQV
jgi:hypothetical protein